MMTRDQLQEMKEDTLHTKVLIPLFEAMGFRDVYLHHGGTLERGKDIIMWKETEIGNRENYAVVVKAQRITGKVADVSEVETQIKQCFGSSYKDPADGSEQSVSRCYVVSSHEIRKEAIEALLPSLKLQNLDKSVTFIGGDKLWRLVREYLIQEALWDSMRRTREILDCASPYYRLDTHTAEGVITINVTEKYPGASLEHPIEVSGTFIMPDTPEGKKVREDLDAFHKRGMPIEVEKPYFEGFELPGFVTQVTGLPDKPSIIRLESKPPKQPLIVRIDAMPSDGVPSSLDHVELVRQRMGGEEIYLTNEEQNMPIKLGLTCNIADKTARIDLRCHFKGLNVKQVLDCLRLQDALSRKGEVVISDVTDDLELLRLPNSGGEIERPPEFCIRLLEDLVFIQAKTKCSLTFPGGMLSDEELEIVGRLKQILTTGKVSGRWNWFNIRLYRDGVTNVLNTVKSASAQGAYLMLENEAVEKIFGQRISLGPAKTTLEKAILQNRMEEIEEFLKTASEGDVLQLSFRPREPNKAVISMSYRNWQNEFLRGPG